MRDAIMLLGFVTLQRLFELLLSRRNEARLKLRGAVEAGANHYPVMVLLHLAWLWVLWLLAWNLQPNMLLIAAFLALQPLRYWVIATLGDRWSTRVFVIPGASLIRTGPYRFFSHPNYLAEFGAKGQSEVYATSSLDLAMKDAFRKMRRFLMSIKGLTEDEAIALMSVAVDFGVTQVVDGVKGAHMAVRRDLRRP